MYLGRGNKWETPPPHAGDPQMYQMLSLRAVGPRDCNVEGCRGREAMRTFLRLHFLHRHVMGTVVFLDEGNLTHPLFPRCDMLEPWAALNGSYTTTAQ